MVKKKSSDAADQTLARVTRSAAAIDAAPMLSFRRHVGSTSSIQVFQTSWLPVIKLMRLF
jgi:hypothetical protein